jgi:hypothetical protein
LPGAYLITTTEGTVTGTAEGINRTLLIPAGTFTASNAFKIRVRTRKNNTGFNQATTRIYIGATNSSLSGAFSLGNVLHTAAGALDFIVMERSAVIISSTNSTVYNLPGGTTASSALTDVNTGNMATSAINWTLNQYVIVTTQTNNAGYSAFVRSIQVIPE